MAEVLDFELVSPERRLAASEADSVTIPGLTGDLTPMLNHAAFLTSMRPGFVTVRSGTGEQTYFVTGGFAEIAQNSVSILAEEAVEKGAVTRAYIEARIREAEEALEAASAERKQAALLKLNDYRALLGQVPG